jgi:hypothetical protein
LSCQRPFGSNPPAAYDAIRFHFEDIGKVTADGNLELELDWFHAIVGDFNVLVYAAADPSTDGEAERARGYGVALRRKGAIGKEYPCGIIGDGAAVKQQPGYTIGVNGPVADNACIAEEQAFVARPFDLPV